MLNWLYHLFGQHSPRERERAGYLKRIEHLNENILSLSDRMHGIEAERDALRAQLADGHAAPRKRASRTKPTTQE